MSESQYNGFQVLLFDDEAAGLVLCMSASSVKKLRLKGIIPSVKVNSMARIHRDDLIAYVDGLRHQSQAA